MQSILVTGGAGFIGSHFIDYILATYPDYRVVILDKLTYSSNQDYLRQAAVCAPDRLRFVEGDPAQEGLARGLLDEYPCDFVVHFAAESHVERSVETPMLFWKSNADGSAHLLEAARLKKVRRFLLVSSVEVYGPQDGEYRPWREDDRIQPPTPYAAAKAAAEHWAFAYWKSYGFPVVITRSCNNYGPRQHAEKQLPSFITRALRGEPLRVDGDGGHRRQWVYVADHCRALDLLLHAEERLVAGEVFNIGGGLQAERTTVQNAQAVLERLGKDLPIHYGPDRKPSLRRLALDSSKLEQRLGWRPQVSFEEGLERTLDFYMRAYLAHPELAAGDRAPEPAQV